MKHPPTKEEDDITLNSPCQPIKKLLDAVVLASRPKFRSDRRRDFDHQEELGGTGMTVPTFVTKTTSEDIKTPAISTSDTIR
jgi:hypothetical protein